MWIVLDASTLILLQKIGLLEKLAENFRLVITSRVHFEAIEKGKEKNLPDAYALERACSQRLLLKKKPKDERRVDELMSKFGAARGETETIALCLEKQDSIAAIDDKRAMRICNVYGIPFVTSLSLVAEAKDLGIVTSKEAREMVEKLRIYVRYKDELVSEALKILEGESNG